MVPRTQIWNWSSSCWRKKGVCDVVVGGHFSGIHARLGEVKERERWGV